MPLTLIGGQLVVSHGVSIIVTTSLTLKTSKRNFQIKLGKSCIIPRTGSLQVLLYISHLLSVVKVDAVASNHIHNDIT